MRSFKAPTGTGALIVPAFAFVFGFGVGAWTVFRGQTRDAGASAPKTGWTFNTKAEVGRSIPSGPIVSGIGTQLGGPKARPPIRYVLPSTRTNIAARLDEHLSRSVEFEIERVDSQYKDLFAKFGLDSERNEDLRRVMYEVHKAKVQVAQYNSQLAFALESYDRIVERELGDNYQAYRTFEGRSLARREMTNIKDYMQQVGVPMSAEEEDQIEGLVANHEAYSHRTLSLYGGPYDPPPDAFSGKAYIPKQLARKAALSEHAANLIHDVKTGPLPTPVAEALEQYYGQQLAVYDVAVEGAKRMPIPTGSGNSAGLIGGGVSPGH